MTIDLSNPSTWPLRMLRAECAAILRISLREMHRRIQQGRFPPPDDGRTWHRSVVQRYVDGGVREFEKRAQRSELRMVSR